MSKYMTLPEWTKSIIDELTAAGFEVSEHEGFPIAKRPTTQKEGVRFLDFKTTLATNRVLYAEGCLFVPRPDSSLRKEREKP